MGSMTCGEMLAANLRAARARVGLDQAVVVERMRALGFASWHRQTMGKVERGERRLMAEEVIALTHVLETTLYGLMSPSGNDDVRFRSGDRVSV